MNTISRRPFVFAALIFCLTLLGVSLPALAQDEGETIRIAVLDVPDGGTDALAESLGAIPQVEVQRQPWFLEQIRSRGFSAKGIMTRPDDLKWLMKGAEITYILYLATDADNPDAYQARLVGAKVGEVVHEFSLDRASSGLSAAGSKLAAREIQDYIDRQKPRDLEAERRARQQAEAAAAKKTAAENPNELKQKTESAKKAAMASFSKDWLRVALRGVGLRRDLHVAGANRAVMAYTSAFYPGFALDIEAFPLGMSNQEFAGIGFYANYVQGFDSITVLDQESNEADISILHLELEGGVLYRLGDPLKLKTSDEAKVDLTVGVRYTNLAADANPVLPSISHISFVIGTQVTRAMFSEAFEVRAGVDVAPIGVYGTGGELFGDSSYTYGAGGHLGAKIAATEALSILAGYEFRLQRTIFSGAGDLEFEDANAFELVQGLSAGVLYQY